MTGGHPTLIAQAGVRLVRQRRLPARGEILVRAGEQVGADCVVARAQPAGALVPVNVAHALDIAPAEVAATLLIAPGQAVMRGEALARTRGLWGFLSASCPAPVTGVVREVSDRNGQVMIEAAAPAVEVLAMLAGRVVDVEPHWGVTVAGRATVVQGILGVGREVCGRLAAAVARPEEVLTAEMIGPELAGRVVLGERRSPALL